MLRIRSLAVVAASAVVVLSACSRKQEPQQPAPQVPTEARDTAADRRAREEQMRRDSLAAAERDAAARRGEIERIRAAIEEMVFFDYDESSIRNDTRTVLDRKVPLLRANPNVRLRLEGHADERGSVEYNLALSLRRANAIRDYLAGFGIDASRFEIVPMGEERPLASGQSEEAYARNRRGEFHITSGGDNLVAPR